ncbi:hypothetical protein T484DRAFT_3222476 [Baffinella frigidus]|nr:hypothetical protein T484DRAFT_3222476 [Cryptophyta sp. CCMP2293]
MGELTGGGRPIRTMLSSAELQGLKDGGRPVREMLAELKGGGGGRREMLETVFDAPIDAARAMFKRAEARSMQAGITSGVGGAGHTAVDGTYSPAAPTDVTGSYVPSGGYVAQERNGVVGPADGGSTNVDGRYHQAGGHIAYAPNAGGLVPVEGRQTEVNVNAVENDG